MKRSIFVYFFSLLLNIVSSAQCDVRFGSLDGRFSFTDVESGETGLQTVTAGVTELLTLTTSHDLWDEVNDDCSVVGGMEDVTIVQTLNTVPYDVYGGTALVGDASDKMNITQNTLGLSGTNSHGSLSSSRSSTGDVRNYTIEVTFAPHIYVEAQDLTVILGSVNSAGKGFESASLIFKNDGASPPEYGTAQYNGFWQDTDGPSGNHPGVVASCPATAPTVNPNIYTTTGTGVYTIAETGTIDLSDACNPVAGTNGSEDNSAVRAVEDAGLNPADRVTGFIFETTVENVGTALADGIYNGTSTNFTSRLTGFDAEISSFVLPVELTDFTVTTDHKQAYLTWQTISEINNDFFAVEHSTDGISFTKIGKIKGNGTTTNRQAYSFVHANPVHGLNYYRLKQFDFDGAFEYSETNVISLEKSGGIHIFPTLVTESITIDRRTDQATDAEISIYKMTGELVLVRQLPATVARVNFNLTQLNRGNYVIRLQTNQEIISSIFYKN